MVARYAKAIVGALIAFLTSMYAALQDQSASGSHVTASEWITAAIALLAALTVVWAVPNTPPG